MSKGEIRLCLDESMGLVSGMEKGACTRDTLCMNDLLQALGIINIHQQAIEDRLVK